MKNEENKRPPYLPIGMCFGVSIGTALGVATDNLATFMPIGLSIGMCIGALMDAKKRKEGKEDPQTEEE